MPNLQRVDEVVATMARRDEQMDELANSFVEREGEVFVSALELGEFLGYKDPKRFNACVDRAQITASQTGRLIAKNFVSPHLFDADSSDRWLSPWAAFASIMEADPSKPRVASAKSYFAALAEDEIAADEARLKERQLYKRNHKELHGAAEKAGVSTGKDHAYFDTAGYMGMYGMPVRDVERAKGVPEGKRLVDCAGTTEVAANNLRMAMTKDSLEQGEAQNKNEANRLHNRKGKIVRNAVIKGTGTPPENLPLADKTIDQLSLEKKREFKAINRS